MPIVPKTYRLCHPLITALFATIAGVVLPYSSAGAATLAGNCNPLHVKTCALPFPSDLFTEEDSASATGRRVVIPNDTFTLFAEETEASPVGLDQDMRPEVLYRDSNGFSAAAPILFELAGELDQASLPADGGKALQVFEIGGNGEPVPVNVGLMKPALTRGVSRKDTVIEAFPRSRWRFGSRYVAVLTHAVKTENGSNFSRTPGLQAVFDSPDSVLGRAHAEALATAIPALRQQGVNADDILAMTFFTVRDQAQVVMPLANLVHKIYNEAPALRGWHVEYTPNANKAIQITGQVRLYQYRDEKGGLIFDTSHPGDEYWADFILIIPQSAAETPAPVVIYGHGIGAEKETMEEWRLIKPNAPAGCIARH